MAFTAKDVQALREKTGCGMMDCKKALTECNGDMDAATDYLREKGLASQAKKASRIAAEGIVSAYTGNGVGVVVELNSETDFVANGDGFKALANEIAEIIAEQNPADVEALLACKKDGKTVEEKVQELFLAVRENIKVRRFARFEGKVVSYVHAGGKIGVMVKFDTELDADNAEFVTMGKNIAMQIAAANPTCIRREEVDTAAVDHEREVLRQQALNEGKPEKIVEKMVEGRLEKYYKEVCLMEQPFVKDPDKTIEQLVKEKIAKIGEKISIRRFTRYQLGEGIEKKEEDFAAEVMAQIK